MLNSTNIKKLLKFSTGIFWLKIKNSDPLIKNQNSNRCFWTLIFKNYRSAELLFLNYMVKMWNIDYKWTRYLEESFAKWPTEFTEDMIPTFQVPPAVSQRRKNDKIETQQQEVSSQVLDFNELDISLRKFAIIECE